MTKFGSSWLPIVFALALSTAAATAYSQPRPGIPQLVEFFDLAVFGENAAQRKNPPILRKWVKAKVSYAIRGQKRTATANVGVTDGHIITLKKFANLNFERVDSQTPSVDIIVWLARPNRMNQVGRSFEEDEKKLVSRSNGRCFTLTKPGSKGKIGSAMVIINSSLPQDDIARCILRGLVVSLGFTRANPKISPSILNVDEKHEKLTFIDAVLLRTLYDSRIMPGTARSSALPLARQVMEDLTKRAKK